MTKLNLSEAFERIRTMCDRVTENKEMSLTEETELCDVLVDETKACLDVLKENQQKAYARIAASEYSRDNPIWLIAGMHKKKEYWLCNALDKHVPDWRNLKYKHLNFDKIFADLKSGIDFRLVSELNHLAPYTLLKQIRNHLKIPKPVFHPRMKRYGEPKNEFEKDIQERCRWIINEKVYYYNISRWMFRTGEDYKNLSGHVLVIDEDNQFILGEEVIQYMLSLQE